VIPVVRSVAVIAAAIALCAPKMPQKARAAYAKVLRTEARDHHFDPLTGVAIIWHESGWRPGAVSRDGEDHGLGQIRARYIGACKGDADPVHHPSQGCRAVKASLHDGSYSIRLMADQITRWRKLCRQKTGRPALLRRWLQGYGGYCNLNQGLWCGLRKVKGRWTEQATPAEVGVIIQCRRRLVSGKPCRRRRR
jgi:hypothetical protein